MATDRTVLVRLKAEVGDFVRGMATAAAATKSLSQNIDTTNDRTAWLAQGLLAIGPALVPLGAAAVPMIAGLATQMGIAGLAAGTTALAFNGVVDSLKALNTYQLEPSAANMEKLRVELEKIGPTGTEFVTYLDSIGSELTTLQDAAREGMLPGVQAGIESLMTMLPQARDIIGQVAEGLGQLASEGGEGLSGDKFSDFFTYLQTDAKPILVDMGRTVGNFADGLGEMVVAFGPLTDRFSGGFLQMSQDFATWAHGLESSDSFADFLDYIDGAIPMVQDFAGSLVDAGVQITEAAAPVGDIMLPALTDLLHVIAALADTPLGSVAIGLAAVTSAYGRLRALGSITTGGIFGSLVGAESGIIGTARAATRARPSLEQFGTSLYRMGQSAEFQSEKTAAANKAVGGYLKGIAPVAGMVAGLAFSMTDLDDRMGIANTTMFGTMGMLGGPWVAALAAAGGAALDAAQGNNDMVESLERAHDIMRENPFDLTGNVDAINQAGDAYTKFHDMLTDGGFLGDFRPADLKNTFEDLFGQSDVEEAYAAWQKLNDEQDRNVGTLRAVGSAIEGVPLDSYTRDLGDLTELGQQLQPAMEALGYSIGGVSGDLLKMDPEQLRVATANMQDWLVANESTEARTRGVGDAIAELGNEALTTAQSADQLATALAALLGPGLNAEQAMDQFKTNLAGMREELQGVGRSFDGFSSGAIKAREVTRGMAENITEVLTTMADNGAGPRQLARQLSSLRQQFIQEGVAIGFSRNAMRERAREMGLTPKLVRTVFKAAGLTETGASIRTLRRDIENLPKDVRTKLETAGYALSKGQVRDLTKQYNLTPKEVRTLLAARDNASRIVKNVQHEADVLEGKDPSVNISAHDNASGTIRSVQGLLNSIDGNTANTYINTYHRDYGRQGVGDQTSADGNVFDFYASGGIRRLPKIGAQQPQIRPYSGVRGLTWSEEGSGPWEAFISGHPAKLARSQAIATEVVSRLGGMAQFARGGFYGGAPASTPSGGSGRERIVERVVVERLADKVTLVDSSGTLGELVVRTSRREVDAEREYRGTLSRQGVA